jgi:hypothetical protein
MIYISQSLYIDTLPTQAGGGFTQGDVDYYGLFTQGGIIRDAFGNEEPVFGDFGPNKPRFGYDNVIEPSSLSADYEREFKPVLNLANDSTAECWRSAEGQEETEQSIYFSAGEGSIDYIGIAAHNLGEIGSSYRLQSRSGLENAHDIDIGGAATGVDIAIDSIDGFFELLVSVDGGVSQLVSVAYSAATNVTFNTLIAEINSVLVGASASIANGNFRIESSTAAPSGSVQILPVNGLNYFAIYVNGYVAMNAVTGWVDVFDAIVAINDRAIMHQFTPRAGDSWRLIMAPPPGNIESLEIGIVWAGRALIMPRGIYIGHTPINYGRKTSVATNRSENGKFLGRIMRNVTLATSAEFTNVGRLFYRIYVDPFVIHAQTKPFFFAVNPERFPNEVAFCWATGDPSTSNETHNFMGFSLNMEAIEA